MRQPYRLAHTSAPLARIRPGNRPGHDGPAPRSRGAGRARRCTQPRRLMASCRARCSSSSAVWSAVWYMAVSRIARSPVRTNGPVLRVGRTAGPDPWAARRKRGRHCPRSQGAQHLGGFGRGRPRASGSRHVGLRAAAPGGGDRMPQAPTRTTDYRTSNYVTRRSHTARRSIRRRRSHQGQRGSPRFRVRP